MKIAQIVCVYPPYKSGISTSALNTARVFASAGHEIETFTIDYGNGGKDSGVTRLKAFPKLGNGGFLPQLLFRLKNFDIVYLHYPFFGAAETVWFLKKFFWKNKTKLIIHFHMEPEFASPFLKILAWPSRLIAPSLFKRADLVICSSFDYAKKNMPAKILSAMEPRSPAEGCGRAKIAEIPYSTDTARFKPLDSPQSSARDRGAAFKILFVGGLDKAHYFKGVDVLLEALSLINKNSSNWKLEIVGSGDLRLRYENKACELGIAGKIAFSGNISEEDLPKKYQEADCLVLPSINKGEAFGIVLLDAMASGIPVIASDLPGVRGVFTEESGLKIKPGDAEDLADKLKFLMDNPEKRAEMGRAARREAEGKYSGEVVSGALVQKINDLVG